MLTDEQIKEIGGLWAWINMNLPEEQEKFARAIEAAACTERDARIAELERQLAEARKDADRYRWLRNEHWENNRLGVVLRPKDQTKLGTFVPSGSLLDDTIDHMRGKDEAIDASDAVLKGKP